MAKNRKDKSEIGKDDVVAGATGAAVGGALAAKIGGLGGAGLVIGGGGVGIPAAVVVAGPALAVGAVAFVGWKVFKALKKK